MLFARKEAVAVPEVGADAPEFNLPSAQGGQLRLSVRTARGPVVVAFYEGTAEEAELAYFRDLASKEDEINMAGGSVVGIGVAEPGEARDFATQTGMRSYVLYDYARVATRDWGLLEKSKERGEHARPATFVVDGDRKVFHAWVGERPRAEEVLAKVSEITGLPKKPAEEAPDEKGAAEEGGEKPKKMTAEERERIKAERRAAREAGKSLKTGETGAETGAGAGAEAGAGAGATPERKRHSPEEREKRRAERRAARQEQAGGEGTAGAARRQEPASEGEGDGAAGSAGGEPGGADAGAQAASEPAEGGAAGGEAPGECEARGKAAAEGG